MDTIGVNIKRKRDSMGITQRELGELLGVSDTIVCRWEKGVLKPDVNDIPAIARILDISIEELFGKDDKQDKVKATTIVDFKHIMHYKAATFACIVVSLMSIIFYVLQDIVYYESLELYISFQVISISSAVISPIFYCFFRLRYLSQIEYKENKFEYNKALRTWEVYFLLIYAVVFIYVAIELKSFIEMIYSVLPMLIILFYVFMVYKVKNMTKKSLLFLFLGIGTNIISFICMNFYVFNNLFVQLFLFYLFSFFYVMAYKFAKIKE